MAKAKRTKEQAIRRRRGVFIAFVIVLIVATMGIVYLILNPSSGKLKADSIVSNFEASAVVIRQEAVVSQSDIYQLRFAVGEGDYVNVGQEIATIYSRGYETQFSAWVDDEQSAYSQQLVLLQSQSGTEELPAALIDLNNQIDYVLDAMIDADGVTLRSLEQRLSGLLVSRREYLLTAVTADTVLTETLSRLSTKYAQIGATVLYNQTQAGYISFFIDSYEESLKLDQLTATLISKVINASSAPSFGSDYLYRIVFSDTWYLAFTESSDSPNRLSVGKYYDVNIKGEEKTYNVQCISEKVNADSVIYVLEVPSDVYEVLSIRKLSIEVRAGATGVSCNLDAIMYIDGVPTVYIKSGNAYVPIAVNILAADETKAIIEAQNEAIVLTEHLRYEYHKSSTEDTATDSGSSGSEGG
ncbi:MAG TPA: HlyD family efflux transporter periplasmic adaptor subunit [Clostridia bacterium]|nr:HlyD family efflux transporter periplasmic adaptor subunit [Clostridia bacterium]